MREKIFKEALDWYEKQGKKAEIDIEDFVNLVINKTADSIFEKDAISSDFLFKSKKNVSPSIPRIMFSVTLREGTSAKC